MLLIGTPPFLLVGPRRDSGVIAPRLPRISRGWAPAITANAHLCPRLPVPAEPLLAATRTRWAGWAVCQSCVRGETDAQSRLRPRSRLGGHGVLECADLDTAIEVAAGHLLAITATVEVRPFWDAPWDRWRRLAKLNRVPGSAVHARLYGVWPRIRLMPRTDSSDFAKNPAAGLSSIISL